MIESKTGLGYYMPENIYHQLLRAKERVRKGKGDRVVIIDGREGSGKSTLAMQLAYAVDETFNINRICFRWDEFNDKARRLKKGKAIIFDEAHDGLSSKSVMSKQNKLLVQLLMEIRQRNLFIFIVLPSIFLLEKYAAIFRSQCLFHTYIGTSNSDKRYYKIYNYKNKKVLYLLGKAFMDYNRPRVNKSFRFYKKLPVTINREEYDNLKLGSFKDLKDKEERLDKRDIKWKKRIVNLWDYMRKDLNMTMEDISNIHKRYGDSIQVPHISQYLADGSKNLQFTSY